MEKRNSDGNPRQCNHQLLCSRVHAVELNRKSRPKSRSDISLFQNDLKIARVLHPAGVQMMAGSDSLDPLNFPGLSLHEELSLLVEAGFTPGEALQAATANPAEFLGTADWGDHSSGRAADILLLDADPLEDTRNTQKISAVFLRGKFFDRAALDQLLPRARAAVR